MELNIISYPCTKNRCYIKGVKRKPIGIQIHSIGCAQGTGKSVADYWNSPNASWLVQYICDSDVEGKVYNTLPEEFYSWADAGYGNRNLITIEMCESDFMVYQPNSASFKITNEKLFKDDIRRSYNGAVLLCADICKRYGWDPFAKLPSGLYLISSHNEGRIAGLSSAHVDPDHVLTYIGKTMNAFREDVRAALSGKVPASSAAEIKWFRVRKSWTDKDSQIGAYEVKDNAINNCPAGYSVFDSDGNAIYSNNAVWLGTQASEFENLTETQAAKKLLELVRRCDDSGILYSVSAAQAILESGYVKTALAKAANNCFGMKTTLSGNSWYSVWDGMSKVTLPTWEVYNGKSVTINADFRKYVSIEESVKDHALYLLGAMNGSKKRYEGLRDAKNYREAITIIKNGGYATDPDYISKICNIIQRFGLDAYDSEVRKHDSDSAPTPVPVPVAGKNTKTVYRVQVGMFDFLTGANTWANFVKNKTKLATGVEKTGKGFQVICGSFDSLAYAKARKYMLMEEFQIDAIVAETEIET